MDGFVNYDALAGSVKVEDIASDEMNARILRGIMNNDPEFETLYLSDRETRDSDDYCPSDAREMGWLGYFVGKNTCIKKLWFGVGNLANLDVEPFVRGASTNTSIKELEMYGIDGGGFFRRMAPFFEKCNGLTDFSAEECNFGVEGCRQLSLALGSCTSRSLIDVSLTGCEIGDDQFGDIAVALSVHPKLEHLSFSGNSIGRNGCKALATLLQFSAANLRTLSIGDNELDGVALEALAHALPECKMLKTLGLWNNPTISANGWKALSLQLENPSCGVQELSISGDVGEEDAIAFVSGLAKNQSLQTLNLGNAINNFTERYYAAVSTLLCDASSVSKTFTSNHTLRQIYPSTSNTPAEVNTLLAINGKRVSKRGIGMFKILKHHEDLSMQPFFEWDLKFLPLAVDWLARAEAISTLDYATRRSIQPRKLAAIYQFVRGMPLVFVESRLRVQLDEIKSSKTKLGREQLKLRHQKLMLDLKQEEVDRRKREIETHEQSIMARLRG